MTQYPYDGAVITSGASQSDDEQLMRAFDQSTNHLMANSILGVESLC